MLSALQIKKNEKKKYFFWHDICYCQFGVAFGTRFAVGCHFGSFRAKSAILAVTSRWLLPLCHPIG